MRQLREMTRTVQSNVVYFVHGFEVDRYRASFLCFIQETDLQAYCYLVNVTVAHIIPLQDTGDNVDGGPLVISLLEDETKGVNVGGGSSSTTTARANHSGGHYSRSSSRDENNRNQLSDVESSPIKCSLWW